MRKVTETEFKRNMGRLLDGVTESKEPVTVTRGEGTVVLVEAGEWAALQKPSMRERFTPIKMNGDPAATLERMRRDERY